MQNIIPLQLACAARDGRAALDLSGEPIAFSLKAHAVQGKQEMVDVISLCTLFDRYNISRCDFLKLDCEGSEFDIILGSQQSPFERITRIVLEYHDHLSQKFSHHDLLQRLEALGFRATAYDRNGTQGMIAAVRLPD